MYENINRYTVFQQVTFILNHVEWTGFWWKRKILDDRNPQ